MKRLLALLLPLALVAGFAACGGDEPTEHDVTTPEQSAEIENILRIGGLFSLSGPNESIGTDQRDAALLFLADRDNQIGPYTVQLLIEDDEAFADTALNEAHNLIEYENVDLLFGAHDVEVGYALGGLAAAERILYLAPSAPGDDLTQRRRNERVIRTSASASQPNHPFGEWAAREGYTRIATVALENAFGHQSVAGFSRAFEEAGGEIAARIWIPAGLPDAAPFLQQLPTDIDAIYIQFDNVAEVSGVLSAIRALGLDVPILGGTKTTDETVLAELDAGLAEGIYSAGAWNTTAAGAAGFAERFSVEFGRVPSSYAAEAYAALQMLEAAIVTAGGFEDYDTFLQAMRDHAVLTVLGNVQIDEWNSAVLDIHIRKVTASGNEYVYTFGSVNQFWTYDPAEFLALPVYGREFTTEMNNQMLELLREVIGGMAAPPEESEETEEAEPGLEPEPEPEDEPEVEVE